MSSIRGFAVSLAWVLASIALASPPPDRPDLTGTLYQYSEPTNPIHAPFGGGFSATPELEGNEIGDALLEFADPRAAMHRLEAIKREKGFRGGRVYAGFTYRIEDSSEDFTELRLVCGVSRAESSSWSRIDHYETYVARYVVGSTPWANFKVADRRERVRAIARCLSGLGDMPPLKPVQRGEIRALYIEPEIYEMATTWLKSREPEGVTGTPEQYRKAIRCMTTLAARKLPNATGDSVVFRVFDRKHFRTRKVSQPIYPGSRFNWEREEVTGHTMLREAGLFVANPRAVNRIRRASSYAEGRGLWPSSYGINEVLNLNGEPLGLFEQVFSSVMDRLPDCRRHAGLFELPDIRPPSMTAGASDCANK